MVSDYFGVRELQTRHHVVATPEAAGQLAFRSGVDMELPEAVGFSAITGAVRDDSLPLADVDAAVARVLRLKFEAGLFDQPFSDVAPIAPDRGTLRNTSATRLFCSSCSNPVRDLRLRPRTRPSPLILINSGWNASRWNRSARGK